MITTQQTTSKADSTADSATTATTDITTTATTDITTTATTNITTTGTTDITTTATTDITTTATTDITTSTTTTTTTSTATTDITTTATTDITTTATATTSYCTDKECAETGLRYFGHDLYNIRSAEMTADECSCICNRDPNCQVWNFAGKKFLIMDFFQFRKKSFKFTWKNL